MATPTLWEGGIDYNTKKVARNGKWISKWDELDAKRNNAEYRIAFVLDAALKKKIGKIYNIG